MEIVKLPAGERAPAESDCISIQENADGRFLLNASALVTCAGDDDEEVGDSSAVIGGVPYATYDEAESAGLAWAAQQCVDQVYVARSDGKTILPE